MAFILDICLDLGEFCHLAEAAGGLYQRRDIRFYLVDGGGRRNFFCGGKDGGDNRVGGCFMVVGLQKKMGFLGVV
jgi:hypothetical protein